jgi:hypothetical protein
MAPGTARDVETVHMRRVGHAMPELQHERLAAAVTFKTEAS